MFTTMENKIIKLTGPQIDYLKENFETLSFGKEFYFAYASQTPNFVGVLLEGEIRVFKKKKVLEIIKPDSLIGLEYLIKGKKIRFDLQVSPNSVLVLLSKTEVMKALKGKKCMLYQLIKQALGS